MEQCTANGKRETGLTLQITGLQQTLIKPCRKRDLPCGSIHAEAGAGNGDPETIENLGKSKLFGLLDWSANHQVGLGSACDPVFLVVGPWKTIEKPWKTKVPPWERMRFLESSVSHGGSS